MKTVQARLGHASATETLNTCAHLWPNSDSGTRSVLDAEMKLARELGDSANERAPVVVPPPRRGFAIARRPVSLRMARGFCGLLLCRETLMKAVF